MSNNARVVDGGEIGVAQWLQAKAARVEPEVAMNPVLVKPEGDTRSQVVVHGRVATDLHDVPWELRGQQLWSPMSESFDDLVARFDLVVLEGAGSPAEINLVDQVNNRMLAHADAAAILVSDIDRGGAFAHLVGTFDLAPASTQARLHGFVLNKFRGDPSLLSLGPQHVRRLTGMAPVGVVPMLPHELPDEEGGTVRSNAPNGSPTVAVVAFPYGSNIDEFHLLGHVAQLSFTSDAEVIGRSDVVILPGSKHVAADMDWLRTTGLADLLSARIAAGGTTIGVCGGAMILGERVDDPHGVEGATTSLGALPIVTTMARDKTVRSTTLRPHGLEGGFAALNGLEIAGYEIRNGVTSVDGDLIDEPGCVARASVFATTVHGIFESPDVLEALFGRRPEPVLEKTFDLLAAAVEEHLDTDWLRRITDAS